jgi:UDP-glucose 4-epimerase
VLCKLIQEPKAYGEVFNVGHTKEISILELAKMVKAMTHSSAEIVFVPYDQAYEEGFEDMRRRLPDLAKIESMIGYKPSMDLGELLGQVIAHEQGRLNGLAPFASTEFGQSYPATNQPV